MILKSNGPNGEGFTSGSLAPLKGQAPHARAAGGFLFLSGLDATLKEGELPLDIGSQSRLVLQKLCTLLEECGISCLDLVEMTVFLQDMRYYGDFNKEYNQLFNKDTGTMITHIRSYSHSGGCCIAF